MEKKIEKLNKKMNKLFVPYEQSIKLKELGFDEPCFGWYSCVDNNVLIKKYVKHI